MLTYRAIKGGAYHIIYQEQEFYGCAIVVTKGVSSKLVNLHKLTKPIQNLTISGNLGRSGVLQCVCVWGGAGGRGGAGGGGAQLDVQAGCTAVLRYRCTAAPRNLMHQSKGGLGGGGAHVACAPLISADLRIFHSPDLPASGFVPLSFAWGEGGSAPLSKVHGSAPAKLYSLFVILVKVINVRSLY